MPRTRLAALAAVLVLAAPGSALAQGAGDDQYEDPFGETPAQTQPDDGLSDEPPVPGGDGDTDGAGDGGSGGNGTDGGTGASEPEASTPPTARAELPNTGSEPLWLALAGLSFLLIGAGLRLRTIDPDAF